MNNIDPDAPILTIAAAAEIKRIMDLENQAVDLKSRVAELERLVEELAMRQPGNRVFAVGDSGTISLPTGKRPKKSNAVEIWRDK
ncbi:MAG: hypothetical protein EBU08_03870 [Micrococcales bacterium]|nr:hypothetical protein [Micrococcales bacterium]